MDLVLGLVTVQVNIKIIKKIGYLVDFLGDTLTRYKLLNIPLFGKKRKYLGENSLNISNVSS